MKLYWNEDCYGWRLTGIVGGNGRWFLGLSVNPKRPSIDYCDCKGIVGDVGLCDGTCKLNTMRIVEFGTHDQGSV